MAKVKIAFAVPAILQSELRESIVKDGYGFRGKSKWVSEAIENLLLITNYPILVNYNDEMTRFNKTETVTVEKSLNHLLEEAITYIRKDFPRLEGVKSRIIRTAILQRLLRKN